MDSVDCLWIGGATSFHREFMCQFPGVSDLVYRTGETIYSSEHLHASHNKIAEDINEKNKRNLILHGLSLALKCVVQQNSVVL